MTTTKRNEVRITWNKRTRIVTVRSGPKAKMVVRSGEDMVFENQHIRLWIDNNMTGLWIPTNT